MTAMEVLALVLRWLHIFAAITAAGGSIFMRFALVPAMATLAPDQRAMLQSAIRRRWAMLLMASILFLLVSGLWNFFLIRDSFLRAGLKLDATYQMLFGIKFLLALVVFFIASLLSGRSEAADRFRQRGPFWMTVNIVLVVVIVCISGVMRAKHTAPNDLYPAGGARTAATPAQA